jgi:aspartate racemase
MKTIGLIGGMSWESSDSYYQIINRQVNEKLGGVHSCRSIMYSVDFQEIADLLHREDWDKLTLKMVEAAQSLEKAGADFIVLCTNTLHKLADSIEQNTGIPFLHIADATAREIKRHHFTKVALLGTKFTMEQDFLKKRFSEKHDIEILIPNQVVRNRIHSIIFEELVKGVINESSRNEFLKIIQDLSHSGAQGIILGCTEIGLLVMPKDTNEVLFDTTLIHATQAVEFALID